jgi:hypothetical protein
MREDYYDGQLAHRKERFSAKIGAAVKPSMRDALLEIALEQDVDYSVILRQTIEKGLEVIYGRKL